MEPPVRLRLSRRKGFNLQALSKRTNGLDVVSVVRPGRWGNPFRVTADRPAPVAVARFREALEQGELPYSAADVILHLRGRNIACWCKPGAVCHGDVLLKMANGNGGIVNS